MAGMPSDCVGCAPTKESVVGMYCQSSPPMIRTVGESCARHSLRSWTGRKLPSSRNALPAPMLSSVQPKETITSCSSQGS